MVRDSDVGPSAYAANPIPAKSTLHSLLFLQDVFTESSSPLKTFPQLCASGYTFLINQELA